MSEPAPAEAEQNEEERPFVQWRDVLEQLRETCAPLFGVLENTSAVINSTHVIIYTDNPLFKVLLSGGNNKASLFGAIADVTGKRYKLGVRAPQAAVSETPAADDPLEALLRAGEESGIPVNRV